MREYLKKLKLIDNFSIEIDIKRDEFVEKFGAIVDNKNLGIWSDEFDLFSTDGNNFKGQVNVNGFKIQRTRNIFSPFSALSIARGTYKIHKGILKIETEISGGYSLLILPIIFSAILLGAVIGSITSDNHQTIVGILSSLFTTLLFLLPLLGIPYLIIRYNLSTIKDELKATFLKIFESKNILL